MRVSIRRTVVAGATAGLTLLIALPTVGPSQARTGQPPRLALVSAQGWHSAANPAEQPARIAFALAYRAANDGYRAAVAAARFAFTHDPIVVSELAARTPVVASSTDPALIIAAGDAYAAAIAEPLAARVAAIDLATAAWLMAIDAAYTTYDTATTSPDEATARATFRASVRAAQVTFKAQTRAANAGFKISAASAHATQRAAINVALEIYLASVKDTGDQEVFEASIAAARAAFRTDADVVAATAARRAAESAARAGYQLSLGAARDAFFAATGHNPHRTRPLLPRV